MRSKISRYTAVLLLAAMLFSLCQSAIITTYAEETGKITDSTVVEVPTEPNSPGGTSEEGLVDLLPPDSTESDNPTEPSNPFDDKIEEVSTDPSSQDTTGVNNPAEPSNPLDTTIEEGSPAPLSPDSAEADGSISILSDSGSTGSDTGGGIGGGSTGGNPGYSGGLLRYMQAGVTVQVLYYRYKDVYNASMLHSQVKNSTVNYNTSSDNARDADGNTLTTIFAPTYMTQSTYFLSSNNYYFGHIFRLKKYPDNFPSNRTYNFTLNSHDIMAGGGGAYFDEITDSDLVNFFTRIILGSDYGSWDIGDVYGDGNSYTKLLKELGVSDTSITNYQKAYNGELSLSSGQDLDDNGVIDEDTLIPVVVWKYTVMQTNLVNSDSGEGVNKTFLLLPYDIAYANSTSAIETWWKTPYNWDYVKNYDSSKKQWIYTSSVLNGLLNLAGRSECNWDCDASYACKMLFGAHGSYHWSWIGSIASTKVIGSGLVNMISSGDHTASGYGNPGYHFRGFWGPFGVGDNTPTGSITITKVSEGSSDKLSGAKFTLYKDANCTIPVTSSDFKTSSSSDNGYIDVATRVSDVNGMIKYTGLYVGAYFLKEITAPAGYKLDSGCITVTVVKNGNTTKTVSNEPDSQPFTLKKQSSADSAIQSQLSDNKMYTLAGAQYDVYVGGVYQETLTTGTDGSAVSTKRYTKNTVITVKESVAPAGYMLDTNSYSFTITSSASSNVFTVKDAPTFDPQAFKFQKKDENTDVAMGNTSFEGAVYKWEYYDNTTWSGTPVRTWYFSTNEFGILGYDSTYLASGYTSDELYMDVEGFSSLPLGSVKITEIEAPLGYKTMPVLKATITQEGDGNGTQAVFEWDAASQEIVFSHDGSADEPYWSAIEDLDDDTYASLGITKLDSNYGVNAPTWANFAGCEFTVYNMSTNPVKIGDFPVAAHGEVCYVFKVGEDGTFLSGRIFPIGTYTIKKTNGNNCRLWKRVEPDEANQFVEMCFDPKFPVSARVREALLQILDEGRKK